MPRPAAFVTGAIGFNAARSRPAFSSECSALPQSLTQSKTFFSGKTVQFTSPVSRTFHARSFSLVSPVALSETAKERIEGLVTSSNIFVFMKGNKLMPQCGFSNTVVQILNRCNVPFETFNVLEDEEIRNGVKEFSSWPTIPQVYINGEFVGGCDIMIELYQSGELEQMLEVAAAS
mmetsp:Transcript_21268/g.35165  ORF Transcript_21268/g.35165 Transcript_21268/m.35165 type:complete len:176 (+) Transcript_21268:35-562(+)|eukprot:CAMPEP_0184646356 /NCGR_PEP_ID=MMETSP0308-20130426/3052_1 /TAXON_ID=38269 /ORGANISM="Gloeochaete witrockiana, Strain SAG 46.84" /LENGTH=175 /DNA_ID=CAMNT_0027076303 /DNA_START=27 /DNA_END=554 /DNA_ORIENTATION=-